MSAISMEKRKQSNTINYLLAIAIILVMIMHSMTFGQSHFNVGKDNHAYNTFLAVLDSVHVPLFFMISGYLCHQQNVPKYYKKKFFQLLIPFFVFTTLKFIPNIFIDHLYDFKSIAKEFVNAYVGGNYYWFSYCLFVLFLIAPLLWKLKNKLVLVGIFSLLLAFNIANGFWGLFADGGFLYLGDVLRNGPFQIYAAISFGTWFLFGYILKQVNAEKLLGKQWIKHGALVLSLAVGTVAITLFAKGMLENVFLRKVMISLPLSYVLLYLFSLVRFKIAPLNYVSKYSYQLFLLDSLIKLALLNLVSMLLPLNIPIIAVLALANVAISTLISYLAHKIPFVKVLFGLS